CASAIQVVCPLELIVETQPQPALAIVDHLRRGFARFRGTSTESTYTQCYVNRGIAYPDGIGLASNPPLPILILLSPVVRFDPAFAPNALLPLPMLLLQRTPSPIAV